MPEATQNSQGLVTQDTTPCKPGLSPRISAGSSPRPGERNRSGPRPSSQHPALPVWHIPTTHQPHPGQNTAADVQAVRTITQPGLCTSTSMSSREQHKALHVLALEKSCLRIPPNPGRSLDSSYRLRRCLQHKLLKQVVQDSSTKVGTMKIITELSSLPPLCVPVLDQPDSIADPTLDNNLTQSTQLL